MIGWIEPRFDARRLALAAIGKVLGPPKSRATGVPERARILVVRPDHLGDLLMLTPALARLRQAYPRAEIVGLVGPWGVPVLQNNPNLDRLIPWKFPWFDRRPRRSALDPYRSLLGLSTLLRRERFDLALQFRADFWWGALAVRLAGVPEQVGYDVPTVRPFLSHAIPLVHGLHAAEENLRLVEEVGGAGPNPPRLEFYPTPADDRRARELLGPEDGRPLVALQVGAGAPVKLWPTERLAAVGRALVVKRGVRPVVVGGAGETRLVDEVAEKVGADAIRLAGATTLGELGAVLQRCALVVGSDSGPLHLAVAVGTPTVHLYGPADPRRFGPFGDPARHRVIQSSWPCCPCNQLAFSPDELKLHRCMERIGVAEVLEASLDLLQE